MPGSGDDNSQRRRAADDARALTAATPSAGGGAGGPRRFAHRLLVRLGRPWATQQQGVNARLIDAIDRLEARLGELERLQLEDQTADLAAALDGLRERVAAASDVVAGAHAVPYTPPGSLERFRDPAAGLVFGYRGAAGADGAGLLDVFAGPEERVRERQGVYAELLAGHAPVLDVAGGRGGFTELVRVLEGRPDGALGAVLSTGTLERLTFEELTRFVELVHTKLRSGGLFVAETVNPHAPHALKTFWADPARRSPVFPEAALVLCRSAGFGSAYVFHPLGIGHVDDDRPVESEYAVVAEKA